MFFEISKKINNSFTKNFEIKKGIFLNCDLGWDESFCNNYRIFFKGYVSEKISKEDFFRKTIQDPTPKFKGNFICILVNSEEIVITNSYSRGFPLWYEQEKSINNLRPQISPVWADKFLRVDKNLKIFENKFNPYNVKIDEIKFDSVLNIIHEKICNSFENFLMENKKPIKIFLTGGIDTLKCYSYLKKFTKNFEIIDYEYKKYTSFMKKNKSALTSFWGYTNMHTWGDLPTILVTGACGDEFFLRGPYTCNLLMLHFGYDIIKLLEHDKECYHYWYFTKDVNKEIFEEQIKKRDKKYWFLIDRYRTFNYVLNNLVNDHQHWHIDNTLFFTPFKDIQITETLLCLQKDALVGQMLNADLSKELIRKNDPNDLNLLSKYKNFNSLQNL